MKKLLIVAVFMMAVLMMLVSCSDSDMPFNGEIKFHALTVTVPEDFVRDSTQSNEDLYVFEKGWYKQMIIISRKDADGDPVELLDSYGNYIVGNGGQAARGKFKDELPCLSAYYENEGKDCYEIVIVHEGSSYAIALRGGSAEDFKALIDTVSIEGLE